jgi:hypothetical protein
MLVIPHGITLQHRQVCCCLQNHYDSNISVMTKLSLLPLLAVIAGSGLYPDWLWGPPSGQATGEKSGQGVKLTIYLSPLVQRLRMYGAVPLLHPYASTAWRSTSSEPEHREALQPPVPRCRLVAILGRTAVLGFYRNSEAWPSSPYQVPVVFTVNIVKTLLKLNKEYPCSSSWL